MLPSIILYKKIFLEMSNWFWHSNEKHNTGQFAEGLQHKMKILLKLNQALNVICQTVFGLTWASLLHYLANWAVLDLRYSYLSSVIVIQIQKKLLNLITYDNDPIHWKDLQSGARSVHCGGQRVIIYNKHVATALFCISLELHSYFLFGLRMCKNNKNNPKL